MKKTKCIPSVYAMGDVAWDVILYPQKELVWGSDVPGRAEWLPGGSAANFAVWASRLGARVKFFGKIGDDFPGRLMVSHLKKEGIQPDLIVVPNVRTARIGVMIGANGERAFIMDKDKQLAFQSSDKMPQIKKNCRLFFFTGYSIFTAGSLEFVKKVLQQVRDLSIPIAFDPASFHLIESYGPKRILQELGHVQFLLLNAEEARSLVENQPEELLKYADMVIVKQGNQGAMVYLPGQKISHPAFPAKVIDTTGAGDAFDAAFLMTYLQSQNVMQALEQGNKLGCWVVEHLGAQPS